VDAVVALGAVIRGETPHFAFISQAAAQALQTLATEIDIPLIFGLLTTETREQAVERAGRDRGDRGGEAARAALAQAALYDELRGRQPAVRGFRAR
jgi:6,7-dimethyl-8-ribityllumazine synthase